MADIQLSDGNDRYTQSTADKDQWNNILAGVGNDTVRLYQGTVLAGPGDDRIEQIASTDWWRAVQAAYWDSPAAVRVDLAAGTADDGWGGRDTLVGVNNAAGSGYDDWLQGNANANEFWPGNGNDTVNGGAGDDRVALPWFEPAPGQPWRQAGLQDVSIEVSVDGRSATIKPLTGQGFNYYFVDVESLWLPSDDPDQWVELPLSDFIRPQDMAEQAIAAGNDMRWNASAAMGSGTTLSYSFASQPPAGVGLSGTRPFSAAEQQVVREILSQTAALTGLHFVEVTDGGDTGGQLRFGVSSQTATKGLSWLPNQSGAGDLAGDVWMDKDSMANLALGSEGYMALLHEIGHALGLRHPRNVDAGDTWGVQLRAVDDRTALTVMSENLSPDGLFRSQWGPLDVLALRHLYGSGDSHSGDDVYRLDAMALGQQFTLVDDGGNDTIDASALPAGVRLDLVPGHSSSAGFAASGVAAVDNLGLPASSWIENAIGSAFDDVLLGNDLDNRLTGGAGNDWIDGGNGIDTAVFAGARADYAVAVRYGQLEVSAIDGESGFDLLDHTERLQFDGIGLAFDLAGHAGTTARLLGAVFGPEAVAQTHYVAIGLQLLDGGMAVDTLMQLALETRLGVGFSAADEVNLLFQNLLGRAASADDLAYWTGALQSGQFTAASLGLLAADLEINADNIDLVGLALAGLPFEV